MRLIDADALKERAIRVSTVKEHYHMKAVGTREIDKAPTIDPNDLRPKGYWIMHDDEILGLSCECSVCHIETCGDTPFCPHCGADMREVTK